MQPCQGPILFEKPPRSQSRVLRDGQEPELAEAPSLAPFPCVLVTCVFLSMESGQRLGYTPDNLFHIRHLAYIGDMPPSVCSLKLVRSRKFVLLRTTSRS